MRRPVALVIVVLLGAAVGIALLLLRQAPFRADGAPETFTGLQPLADDLAWTYELRSNPLPDSPSPLVTAIVGREPVGTEEAWLLQTGVGDVFTSRLLLVDRGGEIWALGADGIEDGRWQRSMFAVPQLFQPRSGPRSWSVDYSDGPASWRFTGTWQQRASGQMTVVGRTGDAWLVEGDLAYEGSRFREVDTLVEGVGLISISTIADGSPLTRWDLVGFGRERGPVEGRYRAMTDGDELLLTVGSTVRFAVAPGDGGPLDDWRIDGAAVTFSAEDGTGRIRWSGRHVAAGLLGTATRDDGSSLVMDFVRVPASAAPGSSPASSPP